MKGKSIFVIEYEIMLPMKNERRVHIFGEKEKREFIQKLESLKETWYAVDLRALKYSTVKELNVEELLDF
ncbi:transcriptional regulator [Virgibacillus sp. M23]|uniref:transcriptional regulator n=1 Tax=Virgibacillus sp. M23 TaxID=3079030 RepID=UPI002A91B6C4|nr:transcriptional regulator [Virgibacillus sp. M23]MDY7043604.1 transcriptional regulator [Virgibacillus sp. M23]